MKIPVDKATQKKEKSKRNKLKNSVRVIGKVPDKKKKWPTGELELFKKIAIERSEWKPYIWVTHIFPNGNFWDKAIFFDDLTVTNFSHIVSKGRDKTKRLDPENIEIVSRAYHEWQHTKQIPQSNYLN